VLPHTEITIALVEEGPPRGEYLFTAETVRRLKRFYERVEHLPYKPGSSEGAYRDYVLAAGWMIPGSFIRPLPPFFKVDLFEQAVWQWLAMLLVIALAVAFAVLILRWTRKKSIPGSN